MITPSREEILLVLKGSFAQFEEVQQKWTSPPAAVKFQILQSENDFMLRISTDSGIQSDPLVFTSTKNIISVTSLSETKLQLDLRGFPPNKVKFCLSFNSAKDKDHFFLILKNAAEELKSRAASDKVMMPNHQQGVRPALLPKPKSNKGAARDIGVAKAGSAKGESQAKGSEIESQMEVLQKSIAIGDCTAASEAAMNLARNKVKLDIRVDEIGDIPGSRSKFSLDVCVEDRQSTGAKIRMTEVTPNMTIGYLKKLVFQEYNFPVEVQRWIIGRRIVKDAETLMENRINSSTPVFLYLISAEKAGITKEEVELSRQAMMAQQMQHMQQVQHMQEVQRLMGPVPLMASPLRDPFQTMPAQPPRLPNRAATRDFPISPPPAPPAPVPPRKPTAEEVGWHCPVCTLINPPTIPGCRACLTERPESYQIPIMGSYIMDDEERKKQEELRRNEELMKEMERRQKVEAQMNRDINFQALLMTEEISLIPNTEPFECLICYTEVPVGEGVLLRECLHTFCKECLEGHILHNTDPVIMCPYNDGTYTCPEALLDREIKALVGPAEYQQYLERGLSVAESQAQNSFHCKTPDCKGFCFYDDNINFFKCPICGEENCLTCKAIHKGMNCKEYQDDLQRRAANDKAAQMTKSMLDKMIQTGEAMRCPRCSIIMLKKEGCDWIMCSMCKLEICWVTKGARWGPAGTGDISGGCKCRVQGKRCHPRCQNCH